MADLLAAYAAESARCDAVIAAAPSLDVLSASRGFSLRWIIVHIIEETGRHLGHIDLLREQADGEVGEEPKAPESPECRTSRSEPTNFRMNQSTESRASATASSTVSAWPCCHASARAASSSWVRIAARVRSFRVVTHQAVPAPISLRRASDLDRS